MRFLELSANGLGSSVRDDVWLMNSGLGGPLATDGLRKPPRALMSGLPRGRGIAFELGGWGSVLYSTDEISELEYEACGRPGCASEYRTSLVSSSVFRAAASASSASQAGLFLNLGSSQKQRSSLLLSICWIVGGT